MGNRTGERLTGPKCIAIVGPLESGKTTLLDAILSRATEQAPAAQGQARSMTMEAGFFTTTFMGESMTFVDCPGSVEFSQEALPVLAAADIAVVVADADDKKLPQLQSILRQLDEIGIPRILFLNKIDLSSGGVRETLKNLQPISTTPLLLRQIPLRKDGIVVGSIDLALERAYIYQEHAPSEITAIPDDDKARELEARFTMLERLADHDDALLEQLLEEIEPPRDAVFNDLAKELRNGSITPVLIGNAEKGNGVLRLLKALRHDAPDVSSTADRLDLDGSGDTLLQVMKTLHTGHGGKISIARVLCGSLSDGAELGAMGRVSGLYKMKGKEQTKVQSTVAGETVALGKIERARTGDILCVGKNEPPELNEIRRAEPVFSMAIRPADRKDEAKLSIALQKLIEEDPSLSLVQRRETGETLLAGQGEMHLRQAKAMLESRYQIAVELRQPTVPYLETIRNDVTQRGSGFEFTETITGGVVPRQYIPSVESGVRESLQRGPLGFPVVDIHVNLADGSYHTVDSSDMAFQMAAKLAMREGLGAAEPVLLEPILKVSVDTPSEATARVTAILSQRRGQIMGFETRTDLTGWDIVEALVPEAEIANLIIELRSATAGAGTYRAKLDHMAELTGRMADDVLAAKKAAA